MPLKLLPTSQASKMLKLAHYLVNIFASSRNVDRNLFVLALVSSKFHLLDFATMHVERTSVF